MLQIRGGRHPVQRYPKSQSLVKRLKEGWRGDPPPLFKDLLKGRPEAGESDNKGSLTGRDLREQTKRRAGSFGVCLLPPDSQNKERLVRPRSHPGSAGAVPAEHLGPWMPAAAWAGRWPRPPQPRWGGRERAARPLPTPPQRLQKLWGSFINSMEGLIKNSP